eukprot:jgi/Picre1/29191/NNA_004584.t1
MLFAGTGIASGNGICVVNSTGMNTEIGKIQEQIEEAAKEDDDTPLKRNLDEFGEALAKIILGVCILVWVININHFLASSLLKVAVALAVAAIPEGLPAVITTCLALGTRKMAKRNAIVRQLPSVETLGCTSIICSDKTGTLTTNQMSAITLVALGASTTDVRDLKVTGTSFDPDGGEVVGLKSIDSAVEAVAQVCALCNDSRVVVQHDSYKSIGQPTESALLVMTEKIGVSTGQDRIKAARKHDPTGACTEYASGFKKVATLEFDRDRKSMSVLCKPLSEGEEEQNGQDSVRRSPRKASRKAGTSADNMLFVKGAAECILERCSTAMLSDGSVVPIDTKLRSSLSKIIDDKAEHALRLLAMAVKKGEDLGDLARLRDPPRPEVAQAIEGCHSAGIRVMVITGDNKLTAEAVCRDIGIFAPGQDTEDASLTGAEFLAMPDLEKKNLLNTPGGICFSRAEPRHKQEIVRILKDMGEIVAMTGDGVNDAPALKLADIGVAMGIAGTEVAKQASDMVLADDNFATVVAAVEEGRSIYDNMKAFIRYMISSNIGEVVSIFLSAALGLPEGLVPVQLLWVNLVTDGPLQQPLDLIRLILISCRNLLDALTSTLSHHGFCSMACRWALRNWESCESWRGFKAAPFTAGSSTVSFDKPCDYFSKGKIKASTLSLSVLVAIEMFNAANALSEDNSILKVPVWSNPWLLMAMAVSFGLHFVILYVPTFATTFSIVPLSINEWLLVLLFALPVVILDEILKFIGRNFINKQAPPAEMVKDKDV